VLAALLQVTAAVFSPKPVDPVILNSGFGR
jgi:hypothetical protein